MVDIKGYEGFYKINKNGEVLSLRRNKLLKLNANNSGYLGCSLSKQGKSVSYSIHRLLAQTFISNPLKKEQINHKDGNKLNNDLNNLEWATREENAHHSTHILGNPSPPSWKGKKGILHNRSIKIYKFDKYGNYIRSFGSMSETARTDKIGVTTIQYKVVNKTKGRGDYYYLSTPHFQL